MTRSAADLAGYRDRIEVVIQGLAQLQPTITGGDVARAVTMDPEIHAVLALHPQGSHHAVKNLHDLVDSYRPNSRSAATNLIALIRIYLLHQIDVLWWSGSARFATSVDILTSPQLVDLEPLRRAGKLRFRYRIQPSLMLPRIARAVGRKVRPRATPPSAGLRYSRAFPETIVLLNEIADEYARRCDASGVAYRKAARAGVWLNSAVRSEEHQEHLRSLGYSALSPSAHCSGHAVDVEMKWLQSVGGDRILQAVLIERLDRGEINVIDEGQAWHLCPHPDLLPKLRETYDLQIGL